jgi:hypothetical protein
MNLIRRNTMPLTSSGKKVMSNLEDEYGNDKGESVFYAMINKKKKGSEKWHGKKKNKLKMMMDEMD